MKTLQPKTESSKEDRFSDLPLDIIFDILSRLPLKTISSCRWVSKPWYNIILNPRFAQIHFTRSQHDFPCAIFPTPSENSGKLIDPDSATAYDLNFKGFRENFALSNDCICVQIVGTVNGLVCFSPDDFDLDYRPVPYYVVNPITSDYVLLPKSPKIDLQPVGSGFGFDLVKNEYKMIRILYNPSMPRLSVESDSDDEEFESEDEDEANDRDENVEYGNKVEIYTLGSGTWREVEFNTNDPSLTITNMRQSNVFLHGCLHWAPQVKTESDAYTSIISFDMSREVFNQTELCFLSALERKKFFNLLVLNNCLCVIDGAFMDGMHVWVMKEYGVDSSWVKEYFIQPQFFYLLWHGYHEVLELKNGEMLLVDREKNLIYYDCKKKISKPIILHDVQGNLVNLHLFHVFLKGSLLTPKAIESNSGGCVPQGGPQLFESV